MANLQPYKKYNAIHYDYATELPEGWQLLPNIAIFQERIERGYENEELLSVTIGRGVIKQSDLDKKDSSTLDKSKYLLVYPDDLVYSMRFRQGASGYSNYKGIVSPACTVLKPRKGVKFNSRYYHYMFRTGFYKNYAERYAYGIADGQMPLRYFDFKRMYSILPPFEVQNSIVEYLDKKNPEIDKFIQNKEKLVVLLENQKKAFIKDFFESGEVEIKLKYILRIQNGDGFSSELVKNEGDFEVFGGNGILGYYNKYNVCNETLIIGRVGALCGNIHYVNKKVWVNDNAMFVKTKHNNRYMYYLLLNANLNSLSFANAQPLITGTLVKNCLTKFHKNKDVQKTIVLNIEDKLDELNLVIEKSQKEIASIKEYRESLITDLITGKRSVPKLQIS